VSVLARWLAAIPPAELALRLVCLDLLLRPIGGPRLRLVFLGLGAAGLLLPPLLRRPALWWALGAASALRVLLLWPLADNHAYLLGYACLGAALALGSAAPDATFARSARWLVALVFAFATAWKLASPDFADGRFFRVSLLRDDRMAAFAQLAGGLGAEEHRALAARLAAAEGGIAGAPAIEEPPRLRAVARGAALATIALEAAIALAFLAPTRSSFARARHPLLLLFCVTTYAIAPVEGFAWLLLALGVAQCDPEAVRTRTLYLAAFALVLVYREVPWLDALVALRDR